VTRAAAALACALGAASIARADPPPAWSYRVRIDPASAEAEVEIALGNVHVSKLCAGREGAGRFVRAIARASDGKPLARDPDDDDCWSLEGSDPARTLRYRFDLAAAAREHHDDPDWVDRAPAATLLTDQALLLRPDPLPPRAPIAVELALPDGLAAFVPWPRAPGPGLRFTLDSDQIDGGSYLAIGRLHPLPDVHPLGGEGVARLAVVEGPRRATDEDLARWVSRALAAVARFYRVLPGGSVAITLVPVAGATDPGVFGTVMRHGFPSVILYFGAAAAPASFADDWVVPHELFHLGNPPVAHRVPWFIEGFTTYYQDVLRARAGLLPPDAAWADLGGGFARRCAPESGRPLADESRRLRELHHYTRVYWGGACLAFLVDSAIRERTGNHRSLDDLLRELRLAPHPLDEPEIISALDRAAGHSLATRVLQSNKPIDYQSTLNRLGVHPIDANHARLDGNAPLSSIARSIMKGE